MIPTTFEAWKNCIINECKIALTPAFALERLAVYKDPKNTETQKFVSLYGEQHLHHIIQWFQIIAND